jgi:hypothetical protein
VSSTHLVVTRAEKGPFFGTLQVITPSDHRVSSLVLASNGYRTKGLIDNWSPHTIALGRARARFRQSMTSESSDVRSYVDQYTRDGVHLRTLWLISRSGFVVFESKKKWPEFRSSSRCWILGRRGVGDIRWNISIPACAVTPDTATCAIKPPFLTLIWIILWRTPAGWFCCVVNSSPGRFLGYVRKGTFLASLPPSAWSHTYIFLCVSLAHVCGGVMPQLLLEKPS